MVTGNVGRVTIPKLYGPNNPLFSKGRWVVALTVLDLDTGEHDTSLTFFRTKRGANRYITKTTPLKTLKHLQLA